MREPVEVQERIEEEAECPCAGPFPEASCPLHGIAAVLRAMWAAEDNRWAASGEGVQRHEQ